MAGRSLNKVQLIGHLGKDPELRYTSNGVAVATFSLATNESYKGKNDEWQEKTEWHNIVAWRRLAEIVGEYLTKGKQVYIEGNLQTRSWDDRDGNKRYTTEIVAREMILLGGRGDMPSHSQRPPHPADSYAQSGGEGVNTQAATPAGQEQMPPDERDDDIPF